MLKFQRPVTPAEISRPLAELCSELVPGTTPFYIDVFPLNEAPADECFPLVRRQVETEGGELVIGWSLREIPSLFVEAEFHAVWRNPADQLIDIAPKKSATKRILFLPNPAKRYEGRQVNNERRAISRDPVIVNYLHAFDRKFEFMNRGERADMHGEIHLQDGEAAEYRKLEQRLVYLGLQVMNLSPSFGPYSPCWCGSGRKVKWCKCPS